MSFAILATIIFLSGIALVILRLFAGLWSKRTSTIAESKVPETAGIDFGPARTSSRLRIVRVFAILLALVVLGLHLFWGFFAAGPLREMPDYALLKNVRDQRNRRDTESHLRGWVFDRTRDVRRSFAKYRYLDGKVIRDYPLGAAAAHLVGYSGLMRGEAQIERALDKMPVPPAETANQSWWQRTFSPQEPGVVGRDIVLTVDFDLQREAFASLSGKAGAVVMLNPQTGELLALATNPSFDPDDVNNDVKWQEVSRDLRNRPLLNRALNDYYLPGSTFKLVTAAAALDSRLDKQKYVCRAEGWTPPGSNRPIRDDQGEAHGSIDIFEALTHSCNQYFAQLGVEVDRVRMGEAASRFGLRVHSTAADSIGTGAYRNLWNTDNQVLSDVLAPLNSTFVAGRRISRYDIALESIGQGYVQLTPMQMAMIVGAVANKKGEVMRPAIEMGREPRALSQAMSAESAERIRQMMKAVVERGTAATPFASYRGKLSAGGKTGTAQRETPVINPKTGEVETYRDSRGIERTKKAHRIDSWFVGFAPVENPRVVIAVVVEAGGYGAKTAAPIAASLLEKALEIGQSAASITASETARRTDSPTSPR